MKIQEILDKAHMSGMYTTGRSISYIKDGLQELALYTDDLIRTGNFASLESTSILFKTDNILDNTTTWTNASDDGISSTSSTLPSHWNSFNISDGDNDVFYGHNTTNDSIYIIKNSANPLSDDGATANECGGLRQTFIVKNNVKTYVQVMVKHPPRNWYVKVTSGGSAADNLRHNNNTDDLFRVRGMEDGVLYPLDFYNCDSMQVEGDSLISNPDRLQYRAGWSGFATFKGSFTYNDSTKATGHAVSLNFVMGIDNLSASQSGGGEFKNPNIHQKIIVIPSDYEHFKAGMNLQVSGTSLNDNIENATPYNTIKYAWVDDASKKRLYFDDWDDLDYETPSTKVTLKAIENLYMDIINNKRFYSIPYDALEIKDVRVKNHLNDKNEYRSVPRMVFEPTELDEDDI